MCTLLEYFQFPVLFTFTPLHLRSKKCTFTPLQLFEHFSYYSYSSGISYDIIKHTLNTLALFYTKAIWNEPIYKLMQYWYFYSSKECQYFLHHWLHTFNWLSLSAMWGHFAFTNKEAKQFFSFEGVRGFQPNDHRQLPFVMISHAQ